MEFLERYSEGAGVRTFSDVLKESLSTNPKLELNEDTSYYSSARTGLILLLHISNPKETSLNYYYLVLQPNSEARPSVVENFTNIQQQLFQLADEIESQINNSSDFISGIIEDL